MEFCHVKNSQRDEIIQKYKRVVVFRRDTVRDDSGNCAVFTEQGASVSHMTAAQVFGTISRLLGCQGQGSGAVGAYIQIKLNRSS